MNSTIEDNAKNFTIPLVKGERPLFYARTVLEDLMREMSRSGNPYNGKGSKEVYYYIAAIEAIENLFLDRCASDRRKNNDDLFNALTQLPLFLPKEMVKKWEIDRIWAAKEFCQYAEIITYYGGVLDGEKISDAYHLLEDNQNYKTYIWKNWFSLVPKEDILHVLNYSKNKWIEWEKSRPENDSIILKNAFLIGEKLSFSEKEITAWGLYQTLVSEKWYNDLWNIVIKEANIEYLFEIWENAFNLEKNSITGMFYEDSQFVRLDIYRSLEAVKANIKKGASLDEISNSLTGFPKLLKLLERKLHNTEHLLTYFATPFSKEGEIFLSDAKKIEQLNKIENAIKNKEISVLIYGASGSGKKTITKYLLNKLNKRGWTIDIKNESADKEKHLLESHLKIVEKLFSDQQDVLILDKENKLLEEYGNEDFVKEFIEEKYCTQIWLTNNLDKINKTLLAKFDAVVEISEMKIEERTQLASQYFKDNDLSLRVAQAVKTPYEIIAAYNWCNNTQEFTWKNVLNYITNTHKVMSDGNMLNLLQPLQLDETLPDFVGYKHIEEVLNRISDYFNHPHIYQKLGAKIPKGILLMGDPGTGKTHFAKHLMKSAGVPMFSVESSRLVAQPLNIPVVFNEVKKYAPCILLMDEIDVLINTPETPLGLDMDKQKILNSFLAQLDGVNSSEGILVIGATHRKIKPDPAAVRSGRLGETIYLNLPNSIARKEIWNAHLKLKPVSEEINYDTLSHASSGFSSAEITEAVNRAAIISAQSRESAITMNSLLQACDNIFWGAEDGGLIINEEERYKTAVHEAGHALIAWKNGFDVKRITVRPRAQALGAVSWQNQEGILSFNKSDLIAKIEVALAGIASEKFMFNQYSNGGTSDLKVARNMLRKLLLEYGFGKEFGISHSFSDLRDSSIWSEKRKLALEEEEREILDKAMHNCLEWLKENKETVEKFAHYLLNEKEVSGEKLDFWKDTVSKEEDNVHSNIKRIKFSKDVHTVHMGDNKDE